ncbi:MAG: ATP-binding cassette domain-containing protein [Candidatus Altiarchaeia archaeon]
MLFISVRKRLRDYKLDVRLEIKDAEIIALTGKNGSGKTTLLNLIAGIDRPDAGKIVVDAYTVYNSAQRVFVPTEKRNIGYVFQHYALFPHLSVYENVAFGLKAKKAQKEEIRLLADEHIFRAGLYHLRNERIQNLSGGEKQKTALARTLITKPKLLLLDEPLSALDAPTAERYRKELRKNITEAGIPSIIVTHNPKDADIADRTYTISNGRILQEIYQ